MAIQTITYQDKVALNQNSDIADINKCNASDLNEIKNVVNNNATETSTNSTNITNIINAEVYSTSEIKTNKTWIDGKPIYRKVIFFTTTISANNLFTLAHNISNLSYYKITEAVVKSNSGLSYTLPMVGYNNSLTDKMFCYMDATNIYFYSNGAWGSIWTKYVTIEYTKTTD